MITQVPLPASWPLRCRCAGLAAFIASFGADRPLGPVEAWPVAVLSAVAKSKSRET